MTTNKEQHMPAFLTLSQGTAVQDSLHTVGAASVLACYMAFGILKAFYNDTGF
ncbi:hypothetical protein GYMLUDRAFT_39652 [Collybiopsis luxurians FD-317 M1]|nr:hypothetical protein GYMLUDRAFT_39652 [Collybiopsis luxurians FD-317 M1]